MKILVKSYEDFRASAQAFGEPVAALYWDGAQSSPPEQSFKITAFVAGGSVAVIYCPDRGGDTAIPPSFRTDYPNAVKLAAKFDIH